MVKWFLIGKHFSKQWLDHNYDNAPHGTGKEQDLSFEMARFQGCTDHVTILPHTHKQTHTTNTDTHTHYTCICVVCMCVCVCCVCLF